MYCKNCGKEIGEGDLFCSQCGTKQVTTYKEVFVRNGLSEQDFIANINKWFQWHPKAGNIACKFDMDTSIGMLANKYTLNRFVIEYELLKGENEYTYPPYSEVQARELIDSLREIAPFIIIDCGSYIANDVLSAVALMETDSVLRLANCDLKSISYLSSQLPLLRDGKWDADKQYKIASNIKPQQGVDHMSQALGSVAFKLPHSQELEEQYLAGNLFEELSMKDSRAFRKEIEKIAREVFGC